MDHSKAIDQTLLHNKIEKSILNCLIDQPDSLYETDLKESYFSIKDHRNVFNTILTLLKARKTIDLTMLCAEMGAEHQDLLLEIYAQYTSSSGLKDYAQELKELRQKKELKAIGSAIELAERYDLQDVLSTTYKKIGELMYQGEEEKTVGDSLNDLLEKAGKPSNRIGMWGYKEIDSKLFGIKAGKFTIIMARPCIGKTLTAVNIMSNLMDQGIKSMMLSGEMIKEEVLQRFLSIRYGIAPSYFESKSGIEIMKMIGESGKDDFAYIPEYIEVSDKSLRDDLIYHQIYTAYHRDNIKVIIIDYIQLATTSSTKQNRAYEIGSISNRIKRISNELGIAVIALAQISREGAKAGVIGLEHLKDCGELEQDADVVIALDKDEDDKGKVRAIDMQILKNRGGGGLGSFSYKVEGAKITSQLTKF